MFDLFSLCSSIWKFPGYTHKCLGSFLESFQFVCAQESVNMQSPLRSAVAPAGFLVPFKRYMLLSYCILTFTPHSCFPFHFVRCPIRGMSIAYMGNAVVSSGVDHRYLEVTDSNGVRGSSFGLGFRTSTVGLTALHLAPWPHISV